MDGQVALQENRTSMQNEEVKMNVVTTMHSKFGLLPEMTSLPQNINGPINPKELPIDAAFREEVEKFLPPVLAEKGRVLIILDIATQHAVATAPAFLRQNVDLYHAYTPRRTNERLEHLKEDNRPNRVMEVVLANKDAVDRAKADMTTQSMRGVAIAIDTHSYLEDEKGDFDIFLPDEIKMKELDLDRIVVMGEFLNDDAPELTKSRLNSKSDNDESRVYDYLRKMKAEGYPVSLIGIETRPKLETTTKKEESKPLSLGVDVSQYNKTNNYGYWTAPPKEFVPKPSK